MFKFSRLTLKKTERPTLTPSTVCEVLLAAWQIPGLSQRHPPSPPQNRAATANDWNQNQNSAYTQVWVLPVL